MKINDVEGSVYGFVLGSPPGWADAPPRATPVANIATRGVRAVGSSIDQPRRIVIRGTVRGATAAAARSNLDQLKLALSLSPVKLAFTDFSTRYVNGRVDSCAVPPEVMGSALSKNLSVEIVVTCHDPFFYDATATSLPTGGVMPLGTGIHRPVITLTSTVSSPPFFLDLKNGAGTVVQTMTINQNGTAAVFVIDCDNQIITKDGVNILDKLTGNFFRIDPLVHATFASSLWPEIVTRNIDSGGTPAITFRKAWR